MTPDRRDVATLTTIARSSFLMAALAAAACAGQAGPASDPTAYGAGTDGAPAPHLRDPAEHGPRFAHAEPAVALPDPATSDAATLAGILAYADVHSPVLAVARSTRSRAEAEKVAADTSLSSNPELTLAAGPRFARAGAGVDVDVTLMQQIRLGGERAGRVAAAKRVAELTDAEIEALRWSVHCEVHAEFHRALIERQRVNLAEKVVKFQREVLSAVERQIAAGEVAPLTLRLAQAEVAQASQALVATQQELEASQLRLVQLAGWPMSRALKISGKIEAPREPPPLGELTELARARLPALRVGAARVRAAGARSQAAENEKWTQPSIGLQYRHEGNPGETSNVVLGVVSVPIPGVQANQGERARARAEVAVASAELGAAERTLEARIAQARGAVVAAAKRNQAYGVEILPQLEENLALLRRAFELGEIDILGLSVGRERFLRIQSDAVAARLDYFVALAGLERVVGVDLWHSEYHGEANE